LIIQHLQETPADVGRSVVASVLSYAAVCWGGREDGVQEGDAMPLVQLGRLAGLPCGRHGAGLSGDGGRERNPVQTAVCHAVYHGQQPSPTHTFRQQRGTFADRLPTQSCSTDGLGRSFVPGAIRTVYYLFTYCTTKSHMYRTLKFDYPFRILRLCYVFLLHVLLFIVFHTGWLYFLQD
jgi:hypothetical protein